MHDTAVIPRQYGPLKCGPQYSACGEHWSSRPRPTDYRSLPGVRGPTLVGVLSSGKAPAMRDHDNTVECTL